MKSISGSGRIAIRRARVTDSEAFTRLLGQLGYPNTTGFARRKIKKLSSGRYDRLVVATHHGQVVGFVSCHIVPLIHQTGNLCRVTALVVAREFHGEGFGRELMIKAEQYASANRCTKIEITSGEHRTWAHDFYRKLGYEEVSKRFLKSLCGKPGSGGGTEARYHRRVMQ
jgi:ribosomal protein S18 acetylase RimI-like enzyme